MGKGTIASALLSYLVLTLGVVDGSSAGTPNTTSLVRANAAAASLQRYYSPSKLNNMWEAGWWHDANNVEALATLLLRNGTSYTSVFDSVLARQLALEIELNGSTDDVGWWGMAWARVHEATAPRSDGRFLRRAQLCFAHMSKLWDDVCGGGLWWSSEKTYKNAVTNELFLALAQRLHALNGDAQYAAWAE